MELIFLFLFIVTCLLSAPAFAFGKERAAPTKDQVLWYAGSSVFLLLCQIGFALFDYAQRTETMFFDLESDIMGYSAKYSLLSLLLGWIPNIHMKRLSFVLALTAMLLLPTIFLISTIRDTLSIAPPPILRH